MTAQVPEKLGRYEVRAEIGRGSMGAVYEAFDPRLERTVAVKTIGVPPGLGAHDLLSFEKRFFTEAHIAVQLSHPGIVMTLDMGRDRDTGLLFLVLERLEGSTLAELLQQGTLAWRTALQVAAGVAEALHHAHDRGVIHRDVTPASIMVLPDGEAKLMGFGIAKIETTRVRRAVSGPFFGTPLYLSPEQALGIPVDNRIDLFALGAVLYQTLTGRIAFGADTPGKIIGRVVLDDLAPPSTVVPGVPSDADYVLARALAKDREQRYRQGHEIAEDLTDVLAGRPPRRREGWLPPRAGAPPQVTEAQVAGLREGVFLPPVEELGPPEDDLVALGLRQSVGGTLVSTARPRTPPTSRRSVASAPVPSVGPGPTDIVEPPPPRSSVEPPTLIVAPAPAPVPSVGPGPTDIVEPPPPRSSVGPPTLIQAPAAVPASRSTATAPQAGAPAPPRTSRPLPGGPTRRRGSRRTAVIALGLAGLAAGIAMFVVAVVFLRPAVPRIDSPAVVDATLPAAPPSEPPPPLTTAPEETATPGAVATTEPTPSPVIAAEPAPTLSPSPVPSKEPRRRVRARPKEPRSVPTAAPAPRYAQLAIDFEHSLKEGTLRVWVDDELLLDERLDGQRTKKVLVFKGHKGSLAQVLEVLPGEHEIRVEVAWDDNVKTRRISGRFEVDTTRRLSAKVGGLLKKGLSLKWE